VGLSKNIAFRLRTLREAAGLSQQEVAERADLSLSLITKMEQARKADPRASTVIALAAALGVKPGQLIEDLIPPPDGMFPDKKKEKKGKKGKKKKKKAEVESTANGARGGAHAGNGTPLASAPAPAALGVVSPDGDGKEKKKKAKGKAK
jgi:transcriptional regulator with XRE-family HTH domain